MVKSTLVLFCLLSPALAATAAEVTPALVHACQGDARRLCGQYIRARDIPAIRYCMTAAGARVSLRCRIAWRTSGN